jgi:hypothetical protein
MADTAKDGRGSALPRSTERLAPWLTAAIFIGFLNLVVGISGDEVFPAGRVAMGFALCASLVMAGLVASRSRQATAEVDRQERARPTREELLGLSNGSDHANDAGTPTYLEGMERWTAAMLELIEHTAAEAEPQDEEIRRELQAASEDTHELHDLLQTSAQAPLSVKSMATVHTVCTLWEVDQQRIERLGARVDADWHRRWCARSVVDRLVRHGGRRRHETVLPYCS